MGHPIALRVVLLCCCLWQSSLSLALAWGPVGHAVIGELVENALLKHDTGLRTLLTRFQHPTQRQQVQQALLGIEPPAPGEALRLLANWPDIQRGEPGMLPFDRQRHYVNLPHHAKYNRRRYCPDGVCSLETLLHQRTILEDRQAPLPQRAVALAWVVHLVGDMHQPLHAGTEEDRGGNLTCTAWLGEASQLIDIDGQKKCSGENLHAVWDSKMLEAVTGVSHPDNITALSREFARLLPPIQGAEPVLRARTAAEWRTVVERWHNETQALILQTGLYPSDNSISERYIQQHYRTLRRQVLRAAVRLAALLQRTLNPSGY
jgi:hypothetical protein